MLSKEEITQLLLEIGFSINEAKVYLGLLKLGSGSVSDLAKKVDVHRVNIYDALERLREKGLVSNVTRKEKNVFQAASPESLQDIIQKKQEKLDLINKYVPELMKQYNAAEEKQTVTYYKGRQGVINALNKFFANKKPIYCFGSTGSTRKYLKHHFEKFRRFIVENKISNKMIYHESKRGSDVGFSNGEVRYVPDIYASPVVIDINEDAVLMIHVEQDDIEAIMIENKHIAFAFMQYFNFFWKMAKP